MTSMRRRAVWLAPILAVAGAGCHALGGPGAPAPFRVEEATIGQIHEAMLARRLSARRLVELYLARIEAYDKQGPYLNALIVVHPRALEIADSLDAELARTGKLTGPLHGTPVIVKDNYDTRDLPTTAGSLSLQGSVPPDDAFQVRRMRAAGAIVLAKSNMAEFAFTPYETVGSLLPGYTRNPYDTKRVTAGSSGGTAAAVAASFGAVGLGTDTGNSIRGPSSHQALVGIRSTMGLTSRDGIIPLNSARDIGGPMARTVEDAVRVFEVIVGHDPADTVTARSVGRIPATGYRSQLVAGGLRGKRIGVFRQISDTPTTDTEVLQRFEEALADLRRAGAVVVDSVNVAEYEELLRTPLSCGRFKWDINAYLATLKNPPVEDLEAIIASRRFHPSIELRLRNSQASDKPPAEDERCQQGEANAGRLRERLRAALSDNRLDALVYPTWGNPPRLIGDLNTPHGDNSQVPAPPAGFPAITVPMGYVRAEGLPVGLSILGDAWTEPVLIEIAYGYEQATRHRRPPAATPALGR